MGGRVCDPIPTYLSVNTIEHCAIYFQVNKYAASMVCILYFRKADSDNLPGIIIKIKGGNGLKDKGVQKKSRLS